jgi:hypothetical protein
MGRRRDTRGFTALLVAALGALVVALALLGVAGSAAWAMWAQDPYPLASGDRVTLSRSGLSVLRDEGQTADARCTLSRGGLRLVLEDVGPERVDLQTGAFEHLEVTSGPVDPGTYDVTCTGPPGLYAARRIAYGDALLVGGLGLAVLVVALVIGTLALVARRRPAHPPSPPRG